LTENPIQNAIAARLLAAEPDDKPCLFGDVMLTGKLFAPNVYFKLKMENHT
jgi:hypothetical protein